MPLPVEEKSMVPTVLVGIGGTGAEVLTRVRRLVEETYGSLDKFPIISFLLIDTDQNYKISNPEASGTSLKEFEKHWAQVSSRQAETIINNLENYPWINSWFPNELERNITSLEAGAGQIRACGRFAFFFNYKSIEKKFHDALKLVKGRESYMQDNYEIKVTNNAVNVFVTGSLSGGTGSGMLIDLGYSLRHWLKSEQSPLITAIVPMPQAFAAINVGDRVLANGYAAMMELSYFSDERTEYVAQFSSQLSDEIRNYKPPFDFTYLVGTKNSESDFTLSQIREMIAQNIFLDMTSDFAPHKRSIRDNIKSSWAEKDPGGRGYSKQFMSFGLSSIEIPIAHIRSSLAYRLAKDFVNWWLNDEAILPPEMLDLVRNDQLKRARLTENELIADLSAAQDRSYSEVISQWINSIRDEINREGWLNCTSQGANMFGSEKGKILQFTDVYLKPKVDSYRADHFRELSPDERIHGDYLKKIYNNRDQAIIAGRKALENEFYSILEDRTKGPKYADAFLVTARQIFEDASAKFRREQDKVWSVNEVNRMRQYENSLAEINEFKDKFGISKKDKMEQYCDQALQGLEGSLIATIQRKTRGAGIQVIERLQEHLNQLETKFKYWQQKLILTRDLFASQSNQKADSADALAINGLKLFERQELNFLYDDLLEQLGGTNTGTKNLRDIGLEAVCSTISSQVLQKLSPLWKENRNATEIMRLFDLTHISEVQNEDIQEIIFQETNSVIEKAPENSRLKTDLAASDRLLKIYNDENVIRNNINIAYKKSQPLILLNRSIMQGEDAGFTEATNRNVAIVGGRYTADPAAQKILPKLQEFIPNNDDVKPLGYPERHRIIFVQETGGFSLRCVEGMIDLRQSYLDWKGRFITAKRAQQQGKSRDLPIPVHITKDPPFWDVFPENDTIFELVVLAKALKILRQEINQKTHCQIIRYTTQTVIGPQNVDLASTWEEVLAVLEVKECRSDREAIQQQLNQRFDSSLTPAAKQTIYTELLAYLEQRAAELTQQGGKDAPEYKREAQIIQNLITSFNIPSISTPPAFLFCTKCGHQNPLSGNFCSSCGHKLK